MSFGENGIAHVEASRKSRPPQPVDYFEELPGSYDIDFDDETAVTGEHSIPANKVSPEDATELESIDLIEVREHWEPGDLQKEDYIPAFSIPGFKNMNVTATLRKYKQRFGDTNNPNQDNIIVDARQRLCAVLDELGGEEKKGASKLLESIFPDILRRATLEAVGLDKTDLHQQLTELQQDKFPGSDTYKSTIKTRMWELVARVPEVAERALGLLRAINTANEQVQKTGSSTTFCGGIIHTLPNGERWAVLANIGDSATYLEHADGELKPLFMEDSLLLFAKKSGTISPEKLVEMQAQPNKKFQIPVTYDIALAMGATPEQAQHYVDQGLELSLSYRKLQSTMFAAVGGAKPIGSLAVVKLAKGDRLHFWTDGIEDFFPNEDGNGTDQQGLRKALTGVTDAERLNHLVETSVQNGENGVATNKDGDDIAGLTIAIE